jgi:small subunit ribosomal protein S17
MSEINGNQAAAPAEPIQARGMRKTRVGVVISDKMDKTIVIAIKARVRHPLYGKIMNKTTKLKAHDEQNACGVGDTVRVMETRPLSRDKRWRLVEIIEKAK